MYGVDDLVTLVTRERRLRGWSARDAAVAGGVSNTTWSKFEAGAPVGEAVRRGVARAFGWSPEWPEHPPTQPPPIDEISQLRREVEALARIVQEQAGQIGELMDVVTALQGRRVGAGSGR